ncbi:MAG: N-acetyltransferase family protein [Caulobacteraceae bacterium]
MHGLMLSIRSARPDDAALVLSFIKGLAEYEKLAHEVTATEAEIAAALFRDNPRAFCDIAEWNGEPAGFALWFYNYSTFTGRHGLYLEDLFVKPEHRGHGVGKALLGHLAARCVAEGLTRLEWWVLDWNEPAIEFYKALDAKPMDEWTVFRVDGEVLETLASGNLSNP